MDQTTQLWNDMQRVAHERDALRAERDRLREALEAALPDLLPFTQAEELARIALGKPRKKLDCVSTHGGAGWPPGSYRDGEFMVCGLCGERVKKARGGGGEAQ